MGPKNFNTKDVYVKSKLLRHTKLYTSTATLTKIPQETIPIILIQYIRPALSNTLKSGGLVPFLFNILFCT